MPGSGAALGLMARLVPLCVALVSLSAFAGAPNLSATKHNLSISGTGTVRATTETEMCVFCHTPHNSSGEKALWNHGNSSATYIPYKSTTLKAAVGQPTGDSKLCLSCHDGTVALGMTQSRRLPITTSGGTTMPAGRSLLGTDLSDDHPVSFTFNSALAARNTQLKDPATYGAQMHLDSTGQLQCTSCHDPHNDSNGKFLVQNNYGSALCLACHNPTLWNTSGHRNSVQTWIGSGQNPWPHTDLKSVAANGCENCHSPHSAGTGPRLLNFALPQDNCLSCHSGSVAAKNIGGEFGKTSVHPVLTTSTSHDEAEDPVNSPTRHSTCVDCHNPHAASGATALRPNAGGALAGVVGINAAGALVNSVTREYELCFRCHADSLTKGPATLPRQYAQTNKRLQFAASSLSYHPVEAAGKNGSVPSLIAPWTTASLMYCTDCHNNDQGPGAGGVGPNGPHGSLYAPLLERNLTLVDFQPESSAAYALCYKCHSEGMLMSDTLHAKHVRDQQTACSTCHDPHGVQTQPHLINFNTLYVTAQCGIISYTDLGAGKSSCTLTCHTHSHSNSSY